MIARKKLLCRDTVILERLQNVVTTYVFKVSHRFVNIFRTFLEAQYLHFKVKKLSRLILVCIFSLGVYS